MTRKFFFDDVRDLPDATWDLARNVTEAIRMLETNTYDVMSLDHDIGFQMMCDDCYDEAKKMLIDGVDEPLEAILKRGCTHKRDGTTLARWMIENLKEWPELIVIHSANAYGAARMYGILCEKTLCLIATYNKEFLRGIE